MDIENQADDTVIENQEPEDAYASVAAAIEEAGAGDTLEPDNTATRPDRARDETGKFAKTVPDKNATSVPVQKEAGSEVVAEVESPAKAIPPIVDKAWTPAAKAKWNELPPEIQAEIVRREEDIHKGFTRFDEERVYGKQMKDVATPYMPMITAEGSTPDRAFAALLKTAHTLRHGSDSEKFALWINTAKDFHIPLPKEFGIDTSKAPTSTSTNPPVNTASVAELVKKELQTHRQQEEEAQIQSQIEAFASDPKHSHFERVKPAMAALLQSGNAKDMEDAYEQACWAIPDIRSTLQQSQQTDTEAQRIVNIRAKTASAKKAGSSVAGAPGRANGTAKPANTNPDPYQSVSDAFDQVGMG